MALAGQPQPGEWEGELTSLPTPSLAPLPWPAEEQAGFIEVLKCLECHIAPASRTAVCLLSGPG